MRISILLVLLGLCGFISKSEAQLPHDRGVNPVFLSWDVAWQKTTAADQKQLSWLQKAQSQPWNTPDRPFTAARIKVDWLFREQPDMDTIVQSLADKAIDKPSSINNFTWAYAAYLRAKKTGRYSKYSLAREELNKTFVPSFEYIRLLYLMPYMSQHALKLYEPVGQRLLKKAPSDEQIKSRMSSWITELPTQAARQQAIAMAQKQISLSPRSPKRWSSLGHVYRRWWNRNEFWMKQPPTPSDARLALQNARRDAKLAIDAYNESIQLASPDSNWRKVEGPRLVKELRVWLAKN